ncbi:MAG: helix-turn-helix domain-containing protein [Nitrospirae bacterium YQR-1]
MDSNLLNIKEASEYLRISSATLYNLMKKDVLKTVKIGKRTLFDKKDIDTFIEQSKRN